ncbi:MAG: CDP-glycerol glycerophosphotransferase family protein [Mogibacterium sp.]|nr:CDP-glycerol glycerophosphotransferase family protein [Mogibacterium sp.]
MLKKENCRTSVSRIETADDSYCVCWNIWRRSADEVLREEDLCLQISDRDFPVIFDGEEELTETAFGQKEFRQRIRTEIPASLAVPQKLNQVYFVHRPEGADAAEEGYRGMVACHDLPFGDAFSNHPELPILCYGTRIDEAANRTTFFFQSNSNWLYFTAREVYVSDAPEEQEKIRLAYEEANSPAGAALRDKIVFFEKKCRRYEESASVLFEKCIDEGHTNARFVIDTKCPAYASIPEKYRPYVVDRNSYEHYLLFFGAGTYISSESFSHLMDTNTSSGYVRMRVLRADYRYAFLQHGVMYMYSLEGRIDFIRGRGFPLHSKVVVSSEREAAHFRDHGKFLDENLIVSGLPKYDRAKRKPDASRIVIMPTWRGFEYNRIKDRPEETTYCKFLIRLAEAVPEELQDRVTVIPHPLVREFLTDVPGLSRYIPKDFSYNAILEETEVLITDYSSIAYDAFYRGAKVLFCWEEKDYCLGQLGFSLMLTEDLAFGPVLWKTDEVTEAIRNVYGKDQDPEDIRRYREIVTFDDDRNTERCYESLKQSGFFGDDGLPRRKITRDMVRGIRSKKYTGFPLLQPGIEVICGGDVLVPQTDYRVRYFRNVKQGKGIVLIQGTGRYRGIAVRRFRITG